MSTVADSLNVREAQLMNEKDPGQIQLEYESSKVMGQAHRPHVPKYAAADDGSGVRVQHNGALQGPKQLHDISLTSCTLRLGHVANNKHSCRFAGHALSAVNMSSQTVLHLLPQGKFTS